MGDSAAAAAAAAEADTVAAAANVGDKALPLVVVARLCTACVFALRLESAPFVIVVVVSVMKARVRPSEGGSKGASMRADDGATALDAGRWYIPLAPSVSVSLLLLAHRRWAASALSPGNIVT